MDTKQVRYAVVGLGHIAKGAILPAFGKPEAGRSKLAAIVSGDREKLKALGDQHRVEQRATYAEFDALCESGAIDAVYLALPNDQHRDFATRAASHKIHVLCEKPLALTVADSKAMIDAARVNKVKLMTAYRLHFEPANTAALKAIQEGRIGEPRYFSSNFSFQVQPPNLRLDGAHGGGTLWDIGVYCINTARRLFGSEPIEVMASRFNSGEARFQEVDEATSVILRFPKERSAIFTTSFGAASCMDWRVVGTEGTVHMEPSYNYRGALKYTLTANGKSEDLYFPGGDQFAPELAHFSECILEDREPGPNGEEGLRDVRVVLAALQSAEQRAAIRVTTSNV